MKFAAVAPAVQRPWPRLLSRELAADYVGLGVSTIDGLPGFPQPKQVGRRRLYDIRDLDRWADALDGQVLDPARAQSHSRDVERSWFQERDAKRNQPDA